LNNIFSNGKKNDIFRFLQITPMAFIQGGANHCIPSPHYLLQDTEIVRVGTTGADILAARIRGR